MQDQEWLTLREAADALGISEVSARRWVKSGKLAAAQPGRKYLIPRSAVDELLSPKAEAPPSSTGEAGAALDRTKMLKLRAMEVKHFTEKWREELKDPNGQNVWWCSGVQALAHGLHDMTRGLGYTQPREGESQEERAARGELQRALEDMHAAADAVMETADTADEAYSAKQEAERRRQAFGIIQGNKSA